MKSQGGGRPPGGGKGRGKRKTETNFVDAYSGASELAPPPSQKDILAVPAKLRKLMQLKASMAGGPRNSSQVDPRAAAGRGKDSSKVGNKNPAVGISRSDGVGGRGASQTTRHGPDTGIPPQSAERRQGTLVRGWAKGEAELKILLEKVDRREKSGISKGVVARRKSYLNEKKKKKKNKGRIEATDPLPAFHKYDKVEFGDIVQAPPKLAFPRKAAEIKVKEKLKGDQAVLRERLRMEAIQAYRQRKEWSSRPGGQALPQLSPVDVEV